MQDKVNQLTSIHDIPYFCVNLIEQVNERPYYKGKNALTKEEKILPLNNQHDAQLCHLINKEVTKINPTLGLTIHAIVPTNNLEDVNQQLIDQGLRLFCDKEKMFCAISLLLYFKQVLKNIQTGWKKTSPAKYPLMSNKPKEHEQDRWEFFTKKMNITDEHELFTELIVKLGKENSLICDSIWRQEKKYDSNMVVDTYYLWIKTTELEHINLIFDLNLHAINLSMHRLAQEYKYIDCHIKHE